MTSPVADPDIDQLDPTQEDRVRLFIRLYIGTVALAAAWIIAIRIFFSDSSSLLVLIVALTALGLALVWAQTLIGRNRFVGTLMWVMLSSWLAEIAFSLLIPLSYTAVVVAVLLPTLLAVPYLTGVQLGPVLGATVLISLLTALAARLQPGLGLESLAPRLVFDLVALIFAPALVALAVLLAWHNHDLLAAQADELRRCRVRLVSAGDRERRHLERALDQGALRTITAAERDLACVAGTHDGDRAAVARRLAVIVDKLAEASRAVRDLAHGVYPPRLAEHGLEPALRAAAAAAALPTTVVATAVPRLTPAREAAVYFCCVEALRNAEKHAGEAAVVTILLEGTDGLHFVVEDSGKGCDPAVLRHRDGFVRMSDRVRAVGGTLQVFRSDSGGVRIVGAVGPSTRNGRTPGLAAAFLAAAWKAASRLLGVSGRTDYHNPLSAVLRAQLIPTVAAAFLVMVFGGVFRSGWLLVLGLLTLSAAATLLLGRRASEQGDTRRALLIAAPAIWIFSLLVVAIVPSALAQSLVQVVTPAVLAIPHIQRHFRRVVVWTVVVAVAIGAISRWSGGVGLESELPEWLVDTGIIATSVANSTVLLFAAYVNHLAQTTRTAQLRESTARVVDAADHVRRMIERDLHDGAQQRLIAASIQVRLLQRQAGGDSDTAQRLVDGVRDDLRNAAVELRDLTRGIYPADLAKHGLAAALRSVAGWSPLRTTVEAEGVGRHDSDIELNVYFFCLEALQNAVKHAGPDATVLIRLAGTEAGDLTFTVSDDGAGCEAETITAGHGFANIRDRVAALGGTVEVDARPGHGVRVGGQLSGARPRAN